MTTLETKVNNMKQQTIGVEVEMNSITRRRASEIVANYFGTRNFDGSYEYGYKAWACKDTKGRVWKFQRDASIIADNDDERCEMVTPILTYDDMEALQDIIRLLRKAGAKSDATRDCGVHIHIGANGHTAQSLRNLANIMASHEQLLIDALGIDRYRVSRWCKVVDREFLYQVNKKKPTTMDKLADIWYTSHHATWDRQAHYNDSRYHMLNYHATFTKGTIEFRLFQFDAPSGNKQNGLHAGQLKSYIQLCLALSQMAKDVRSASNKPQQTENPKYAMRTWLLRLGFIGEEFATARDFLTRKLEGDSAFRSGIREVA